MYKYFRNLVLLIVVIFFIFSPFSQVKATLTKDGDVLQFIQDAFHAQVSLSEKGRGLAEIDEILTPYFTEKAKVKFLDENLFEENDQYYTLGTDFPIYYIPFFSYEAETEVIWLDDKIYIIEFFPKNEDGPVLYDDHYEGVLLERESGNWKVADFLYDLNPIEINGQEKDVDIQQISTKDERLFSTIEYGKTSFDLGCFMHPVTDFYRYGYSVLNSHSKNIVLEQARK